MAVDPRAVQVRMERLMDELGAAGKRLASSAIQSETLRRALVFERISFRWGRLVVPHYWAIYQHDGRGRVTPVRAKMLVYYADPNDDPRLSGGYPVRLSDVRRLTGAEFEEGLEKNRELYAANPGGGRQQFMRVRKASGPTRPSRSYPFFEKGMVAFPAQAAEIIDRFVSREMRAFARVEKSTATLRI